MNVFTLQEQIEGHTYKALPPWRDIKWKRCGFFKKNLDCLAVSIHIIKNNDLILLVILIKILGYVLSTGDFVLQFFALF